MNKREKDKASTKAKKQKATQRKDIKKKATLPDCPQRDEAIARLHRAGARFAEDERRQLAALIGG